MHTIMVPPCQDMVWKLLEAKANPDLIVFMFCHQKHLNKEIYLNIKRIMCRCIMMTPFYSLFDHSSCTPWLCV